MVGELGVLKDGVYSSTVFETAKGGESVVIFNLSESEVLESGIPVAYKV